MYKETDDREGHIPCMPPVTERDEISVGGHHLVLDALAVLLAHVREAEPIEHIRVRIVIVVAVRVGRRTRDERSARDGDAVRERKRLQDQARHGDCTVLEMGWKGRCVREDLLRPRPL